MSQHIIESASISPSEIAAGDSDEIVITLIAGADYTERPSRIIFDFPATLGMSRPSLTHAEDHGFMEVRVTNPDVTYTKRNWDMEIADFGSMKKSSWRGMAQRMFVLDLSPGVVAGDTIEVHWGETGGGYGPGTKATTVVPRPNYNAPIHVRYFPNHDDGLPDFGRSFDGHYRPEPECEIPLRLKITPRKHHHLRLLRKVDGALLVPHDVFWNVTSTADSLRIVEASEACDKNEFDVFTYKNRNVQIQSKGLPLSETPSMHDVFEGANIYWGDIHTHSAFSIDCIEREKLQMKPGDLMAFARRRAGLDFYAVTDHHQPWDTGRHRLGPTFWNRTMDAVGEHHDPGSFVVFPGIEYRCPRGDTAVLFNWIPEYSEIEQSSWTDIRRLWDGLAGKDYLAIPHFHNGGSLPDGEWWSNIEDGVEPVLEMFSCHGSYEREDVLEQGRSMMKSFRHDRCGVYFLEQGYHYGFCANSDGHKGHVGSNGVTAVYSTSLTRDAIFQAYRDRHVYATTHARIRLLFTANGKLMGSVLPASSERVFTIDVVGEHALKKIDVFRNGALWKRLIPEGITFSAEIVDADASRYSQRENAGADAGTAYYYVRVTQLDNHVAWSSPIWFE